MKQEVVAFECNFNYHEKCLTTNFEFRRHFTQLSEEICNPLILPCYPFTHVFSKALYIITLSLYIAHFAIRTYVEYVEWLESVLKISAVIFYRENTIVYECFVGTVERGIIQSNGNQRFFHSMNIFPSMKKRRFSLIPSSPLSWP